MLKHKCGQCGKPTLIIVKLGNDKRYLCKEHNKQHNNYDKDFFPVFIKANRLDLYD